MFILILLTFFSLFCAEEFIGVKEYEQATINDSKNDENIFLAIGFNLLKNHPINAQNYLANFLAQNPYGEINAWAIIALGLSYLKSDPNFAQQLFLKAAINKNFKVPQAIGSYNLGLILAQKQKPLSAHYQFYLLLKEEADPDIQEKARFKIKECCNAFVWFHEFMDEKIVILFSQSKEAPLYNKLVLAGTIMKYDKASTLAHLRELLSACENNSIGKTAKTALLSWWAELGIGICLAESDPKTTLKIFESYALNTSTTLGIKRAARYNFGLTHKIMGEDFLAASSWAKLTQLTKSHKLLTLLDSQQKLLKERVNSSNSSATQSVYTGQDSQIQRS